MRRALIIDGKNLAYRAGFAGDSSRPNYVLSVFLNILHSILLKFPPRFVLIVWDDGHYRWRRSVCPTYKRSPKPPDPLTLEIQRQIWNLRKNLLPLFPILQWSVEETEADDLVYAAVQVLDRQFEQIIIVSTDRDFYQLLDQADVYAFVQEELYTKRKFRKDYGFDPLQWPQYRALWGDASDNVAGVWGIGQVRAQAILQAGGLERALEDGNLSKGVMEKLQDGQEIYQQCLQLLDLSVYPHSEDLQDGFRGLYRTFVPQMNPAHLKSYLIRKSLLLPLREFPKWIMAFKQLDYAHSS